MSREHKTQTQQYPKNRVRGADHYHSGRLADRNGGEAERPLRLDIRVRQPVEHRGGASPVRQTHFYCHENAVDHADSGGSGDGPEPVSAVRHSGRPGQGGEAYPPLPGENRGQPPPGQGSSGAAGIGKIAPPATSFTIFPSMKTGLCTKIPASAIWATERKRWRP